MAGVSMQTLHTPRAGYAVMYLSLETGTCVLLFVCFLFGASKKNSNRPGNQQDTISRAVWAKGKFCSMF